MKGLLRRLLPKGVRLGIQRGRAWFAAIRYGFPSRKLTVVAVTGTNGKSTVVSLIGQLLHASGKRVGWISTATIRIGDREVLNATKLTTPSAAFLQRKLAEMVRAGCEIAVIEASSEGLEQGRLNGVDPEIAVFTNLTPEHIEAHGSFEAYRRAKGLLFAHLVTAKRKGKTTRSIVNIDDRHAPRFLQYYADVKVGCTLGVTQTEQEEGVRVLHAAQIIDAEGGTIFSLEGQELHLPLYGRFNVMNALQAIAVAREFGMSLEDIAHALPTLQAIPGRMEFLDDLSLPFRVLVDYAPEPASMHALYSVLPRFHAQRILHVFGSAGGGRDRARRPVLGKFVTEHADVAIITNEDPYDEDPKQIINDILVGTQHASPHRAKVETHMDRREAIDRALHLAHEGDLVVITGKACEQWIMGANGTKTPWDDRRVVREVVAQRMSPSSAGKTVQ